MVWTMWQSSASSAAAITTKLGKRAEVSEVEAPGVGRSVGADQPGAIHREPHRQVLDRDVVDDLVVGALEEGRINRRERPVALRGQPAAKVTACCSAMPTSNMRSGNFSATLSRPVPDGIAAVIATTFSSRSISSVSALAYTLV